MSTTPDTNLTGPRIREARENKGISEADLSELCQALEVELTPEEVSEIEAQTRIVSDFELIALAKALEVSGTQLLFGDAPHPGKKS